MFEIYATISQNCLLFSDRRSEILLTMDAVNEPN